MKALTTVACTITDENESFTHESINMVDIKEGNVDLDVPFSSSVNIIHINIPDSPEILPKIYESKDQFSKFHNSNPIIYQIKSDENIRARIYPTVEKEESPVLIIPSTYQKLEQEINKGIVSAHKVLVSTDLNNLRSAVNGSPIDHYIDTEYIHISNNITIKDSQLCYGLKEKNASTADCYTQTIPENACQDDQNKSCNIFFCTFHKNGDAETLCNFSPVLKMGQNKRKFKRGTLKVAMEDENNSMASPLIIASAISNDLKNKSACELSPSVQLIHTGRKRGRPKLSYCDPSHLDWDKEFLEDSNIESGEETSVLYFSVSEEKGYGLRTQRRLKKHSDMHYNSMKAQPKIKSKIGLLKCTFCPEQYSTFCKLQKHSKIVHNSSKFSFPCDLCEVTFTRPHNLRRHKEAKHAAGEKKFLCEHCGRRFNRQDVLASHTYLVHLKTIYKNKKLFGKKKPAFQCFYCDKPFSRIQNFTAHQSGNLTCSKCSITFVCKTRLRNHLYKQHPVTCCICSKACANKQQMYFHKLTHTPKFNCKFCNKGFLWESQYTVHLATHTGNKPLICEVCGKSFAHKNAVNKHKWQEHTEANKKFPCKVCGRAFVYKAKLESHLRSHTGEKPFVCHLCPSSFSQNCNLAAHVKSIHGVYVQSVKSDGSMQTQLVKYRRVPKKLSKSSDSTMPPHSPDQVATVSIQNTLANSNELKEEVVQQDEFDATVYANEEVQFTDSFNNEKTIYQIVYTYPQ